MEHNSTYAPFFQLGMLNISVSGQQNKQLIVGTSGDIVVLSGGPCSGGMFSGGRYQRIGVVAASGLGVIVVPYHRSGLPVAVFGTAIFL